MCIRDRLELEDQGPLDRALDRVLASVAG